MWYEMLPSVAIIYGALILPPYVTVVVNKLLTGKTSARYWENHPKDFHIYLRDRRVTGSEYKPQGLEGVPKLDYFVKTTP